ncbi:MAG: hypothetical protein LIO93_03270 [Bacteroidales bacterium]|nr:hypothetical protein [Bacteroidales bacterium]
MKNKFLMLLVIVTVAFQQKVFAQLPQVSTEGSPVWYYIQVKGSANDREDRVFTIEGDRVFGRKISSSLTNSQLWRFEKEGEAYVIISQTGVTKKLDVTFDKDKKIRCLSVSENPTTKFEIATNQGSLTKYYSIKVTVPPSEGTAAEVYAHQANAGGLRDYDIMLVDEEFYAGDNSAFAFVAYADLNLEYSTDITWVWYTIHTNKEGISNKCLTDASVALNSAMKVAVEDYRENDASQLWKLVLTNSRINFVNKATGNVIQTKSDIADDIIYNYTQLTGNADDSKGWTLNYIGIGQYSISGVEEDNITRYLNATTENTTPDEYDQNNLGFTSFAWKFVRRGGGTIISIPDIKEDDATLQPYSVNRRVFVKGTDDYVVRNIQGIIVNKDAELPIGVYLVTVNGKTTKLLVK